MNAPIGVFDSGLGGLTVLKALKETLPMESFIYLGDVARLPYGNKSINVVNAYSRSCARFLERSGVKLIVVACNTATALSLKNLQEEFSIPVVGVIEGGVESVLRAGNCRKVLVLATDSTVRNEAYLREFNRRGFTGVVKQMACPLLVPLAEEGWWDHSITANVISTYLQSEGVAAFEYDTVVLGCTHYPLLEPSLRRVLPPQTRILHGGSAVAEHVREILTARGLHATASAEPHTVFFATDSVSPNLPLLKFCETMGKIGFELASLE